MTAINIAITDMNLHLPHWWIVSAVFCPAYAFFNYIGGYQLGEQLGHIGSVYGIEDWDKNFGLTLIAAIVVGLVLPKVDFLLFHAKSSNGSDQRRHQMNLIKFGTKTKLIKNLKRTESTQFNEFIEFLN